MSLILREATDADGPAILDLLELTAAKGNIQLLYTRRPDPIASFKREAPDAKVLVWTDAGKVVAMGALLTRDFYVDGKIRRGTYITSLKKRPGVGQRLDLAGTQAVVTSLGADFYYFSVLDDNAMVTRAFRGVRFGDHEATMGPLGGFTTFFVKAGGRNRLPAGREFRVCERGDEAALTEFYGWLGPAAGLFPVGTPWRDNVGLSLSDFYVVTSGGGRIVAAGALWDQTDYRQYIVDRYSLGLRMARLLNPGLWLLGYPRLPKAGSVISFPMASFLLAEPGEESALLSGLSVAARRRGYEQWVAGVAHTSAFHPCVAKRRHVGFESTLYQVFPVTCDNQLKDISGVQCAYL